MFHIGDLVIGNAQATEHYGVTQEGYIGEVVDIYDENYFEIKGPTGDKYRVCSKCFDLHERSKRSEDIEKSEMSILLRRNYQWVKALYDVKHNKVCTEMHANITAWEIIDIKNDERLKVIKCVNCGEILPNTEEAKQEHANRYKKLDSCVNCRYLYKDHIETKTHDITELEDGTVVASVITTSNCYCGRGFSNNTIKKAKEDNCYYKDCNRFEQFDDVHVRYPHAFSKIATVDAIDNKKWKIDTDRLNDNHYVFKASKRFTLYAFVNQMGIVDYFEYKYQGNTSMFMYSEKYNKLFFYNRYGYMNDKSAFIDEERYNEILETVSKIYKGE